MKINDICRLCMGTDSLISIYKVEDGVSIHDKAKKCAVVNMELDDRLPDFICNTCEAKLHIFYEFKLQCELSQKKIIKICDKSEYNLLMDCAEGKQLGKQLDVNTFIKKETMLYDQMENEMSDEHETLDNWLHDDYGIMDADESVKRETSFTNEDNIKNRNGDLLKIELDEGSYTCPSGFVSSVYGTHKLNKSYKKGRSKKIKYNKTKPIKVKVKKEPVSHQCEQCGKIFKLKSILKQHLLTHTDEKLFACHLCPKRYKRAEHRDVHMRCHTGIKPYICDVCSRSSKTRGDLLRHMKIHSDERNYSCPRCERRFKRSADVHKHMRSHTGVRPFICKLCEKTYTSHSGLLKHNKTHAKCDKMPMEELKSIVDSSPCGNVPVTEFSNRKVLIMS